MPNKVRKIFITTVANYLKKTEQNYASIEREELALKWALKKSQIIFIGKSVPNGRRSPTIIKNIRR